MAKRLIDSQRVSISAFIESRMSELEIAQKCGVSRSTVQRYKRKMFNETRSVSREVKSLKEHLYGKLVNAADSMIDAIDEDKLKKANIQQLSIGTGIMIDKARLISGESTENHAHVHIANIVIDLDNALRQKSKAKEEGDL